MDFDPYSDQGHGNHKLDHWAQLLSTSQGRIPLSMSTVHRSNEGFAPFCILKGSVEKRDQWAFYCSEMKLV